MKGKQHGGPRGGGPRGGGPRKDKKAHARRKLQEKREREQQGGRLLRRPDIKGLDGYTSSAEMQKKKKEGGPPKTFNKQQHSRHSSNAEEKQRGPRGPKGPEGGPHGGPRKEKKFVQGPPGPRRNEGGPKGANGEEEPRKRKLIDGQDKLRRLLEKHPQLLHAGETADAAVAACFKKAARQQADSTDPDSSPPQQQDQQQQQQLSGSKRRKLLRLVISSKTADDKVFVHESYQLYNEILRGIRQTEESGGGAPEGSGGPGGPRSKSTLQRIVERAVKFLEAPLSRVGLSGVCVFVSMLSTCSQCLLEDAP